MFGHHYGGLPLPKFKVAAIRLEYPSTSPFLLKDMTQTLQKKYSKVAKVFHGEPNVNELEDFEGEPAHIKLASFIIIC